MSSQAIRKSIAVVIAVVLLITAFSFTAFAVSDFTASSLSYELNFFNSNGTATDLTSEVRSSISIVDDVEVRNFLMPAHNTVNNFDFAVFTAYKFDDLRAGHEYNLKFGYGFSSFRTTEFRVMLRFYDGDGRILKTQTIYEKSGSLIPQNHIVNVNINFTPDTSDLNVGYNTKLIFHFTDTNQNPNAQINYRITNSISFKDLDDKTGFIDGILDWFSSLYYGVVGGTDSSGNSHTGIVQGIVSGLNSLGTTLSTAFNNVGNAITTKLNDVKTGITSTLDNVKNSITTKIDGMQQWFVNLGDKIGDFFNSLKNWLLYFKNPVTINADGTPVDGNGNPVYTNPFDSVFGTVKAKLDEWINKLKDFCDNLDFSSMNVLSYLSTFTNAYNRFFGSNSGKLIGLVVSLAFVLIVIKKVVGR